MTGAVHSSAAKVNVRSCVRVIAEALLHRNHTFPSAMCFFFVTSLDYFSPCQRPNVFVALHLPRSVTVDAFPLPLELHET